MVSKNPGREDALTDNQRRFTDDAIALSGAPRSGTTLLGKIVGTFSGLDYHYEPPTVYMVCALAASGRLPQDVAADLLRVHLYEDLLVESLHGRRFNPRASDDSFALNTLEWRELLDRWGTVRGRGDAAARLKKKPVRVAFKTPAMTDAAPFLLDALPKSQLVLTVRDGREIVRSILKKGWMEDESLREELWPYRASGGAKVPYWVEDAASARWRRWNAPTRACHMARRLAEWSLVLKDSPALRARRVLFVRYEDLIRRPREVIDEVAGFLRCGRTPLTDAREREIRVPETAAPNAPREDFYPQVEAAELARFKDVNARWGY